MRSGLIVGFDHDGPDIFDTSYEFFQSTPLPELVVNVLEPSVGTPLHARLQREGRLLGEGLWTEVRPDLCGFVPKLMTPHELAEGVRSLAEALYRTDAFERRVLRMIELLRPDEEAASSRRNRDRGSDRSRNATTILGRISRRGPVEKRMLSRVLEAANTKPGALRPAISSLIYFEQQRALIDIQPPSGATTSAHETMAA